MTNQSNLTAVKITALIALSAVFMLNVFPALAYTQAQADACNQECATAGGADCSSSCTTKLNLQDQQSTASTATTDNKKECGFTFCLNVPIGSIKGFNVEADTLGNYIQAWYGFLLGTIGILATVMIMWGGFKYLTSRGDKGMIDAAKTNIISAITGVVLAFGTYTILSIINPGLLTISMPEIAAIKGGDELKLTGVGSGEALANGGTYNNQTYSAATPSAQPTASGAPGSWGGAYGYGSAYVSSLPDLGGPNVQQSTRNIEAAISAATGYTGTNDYRPGDGSGVHFNGGAIDYPVNEQTNQYFSSLIQGHASTWSWNGQPGYDLTNVNIGGTVYPVIRIIDERAHNNDWHIDQGK